MTSKPIWCTFGWHDWEKIDDRDGERVVELWLDTHDFDFVPWPNPINRVCLACEKLDMQATKFLKDVETRKARIDKIMKNDSTRS